MADLPRYVIACLHSVKLAGLAIMVSAGIVMQILACALYKNWWPMLTVIIDGGIWVDATKFLTGASVVGSIAIPAILKHANVIGWGALLMELSSFFIFGLAIICYIQMSNEDEYGYL